MSEFLPFSRPSMGDAELAALREVLQSGWITTGPKNQALEEAFCTLTGNRHAIAVSSATGGMHVTLMGLGIGAGDEVITPSQTWVSTLNMICLLGATPVMIDVDRDNLMITAEAVEAAITPNTKAIIPVHYAGAPADIDAILRAAIETDTVLELNTRRLGSRTACRELMPVYTRYRELGGRYVTLGSDAHTSDAVAVNFGAAEELAAMVGLGLVTFVERRMVPCTK